MNYEKKDFRKLYEDLVKSDWFKKAYHDKSFGDCPFDIPELRESEDERIRKAIIHYILYETKGNISEATEHVWVTWLEKQKEQKPIKMEVYEAGKGTTICGQDYKCKKDYKEGNCWYIKDVIYHCGRDGYLTDQNGVSWSCTPEWFKEYIQSNTEWAEEEKNCFVSGQFLQCKLSFDEFKEGEHYWLEYVGDDTYVGRSDNILNLKFHITPRQLYTLFTQHLEEKQKEQKPNPLYGSTEEYYREAYYDQPEKEQKPAEWSEEDENKIESIKGLITTGRFADTNTIRTIWNLLDSLRPSWKPSEEQMEALEECGECKRCIKELREQLKNLM